MMKLKLTSLVSFALLLVLAGTLWCQNSETGNDVIFVKQLGEEGVYSKTIGKILKLTSSEIIMETDGKQLLYTRKETERKWCQVLTCDIRPCIVDSVWEGR